LNHHGLTPHTRISQCSGGWKHKNNRRPRIPSLGWRVPSVCLQGGLGDDRLFRNNQLAVQRRGVLVLRDSMNGKHPGSSDVDEEGSINKDTIIVVDWQAGDVDHDLELLRQAIAQQDASAKVEESNRLHRLLYMYQCKRPVLRDGVKYVVVPLLLSFAFASSLLSHYGASSSIRLGSVATRAILGYMTIMQVHYLTFTLAAPGILLLWLRLQNKRKSNTSKEGDASSQRQDIPAETIWWKMKQLRRDPEEDCSDHGLCLMEQITSSTIVTAAATMICYMIGKWRRSFDYNYSHAGSIAIGPPQAAAAIATTMIAAMVPLITRTASVCALHQYPKLYYNLSRDNQPRPMIKSQSFAKEFVDFTLWSYPFALVAEATKITTLLMALRCRQSTTQHLAQRLLLPFPSILYSAVGQGPSAKFILPGILVTTLLPSLLHMICFVKLIRTTLDGVVPLNMPYSEAKEVLAEEESKISLLRWKWYLSWRSPRRIKYTLISWWRLFVAEYVSPFDRAPDRMYSPSLLSSSIRMSSNGATLSGRNVSVDGNAMLPVEESSNHMLRVHAQYLKDNPVKAYSRSDRSQWVSTSMERMARNLQESYDAKTFDDPLGIAVHQTLGVGLSFDYDHTSLLQAGEKPSVYRLRARAAKSAVRRANDLFDPKRASDILSGIEDTQERARVATELRRNAQKEVDYLAQRLVELTPTNAPLDPGLTEKFRVMKESQMLGLDIPDPQDLVAQEGTTPSSGLDELIRQEILDDEVELDDMRRAMAGGDDEDEDERGDIEDGKTREEIFC
jgi:hypothetical protein